MASIIQRPISPNTWLYKDDESTGERLFRDYIIRPDSVTPWNECTDADKEAWEAAHPQEVQEVQESINE